MNIDQLRQQFPDEKSCRQFFENARWPNGRICAHCGHDVSYLIKGNSKRPDRYECNKCKRQFTVTTKTPLHCTKLKLWKWLEAMYLIVSSSKGISSVVLSRWIGVTQPTAWKMGHAIRKMMDPSQSDAGLLTGVVELDEMYVGGSPSPQDGQKCKRGKGTSKQWVLIAAQRHGPVRAVPIDRETVAQMQPIIDHHIDKDSHLMSDKHRSYVSMGKQFSAHSHVNHSKHEYSRGDVHNNTAESFNGNFKRAQIGVFHYISDKHLSWYLHEFEFRWENRVKDKKRTKTGEYKNVMKPIPIIDMLIILIMRLSGIRLRRTKAWRIEDIAFI